MILYGFTSFWNVSILLYVAGCSATAKGFQTLPDLLGDTQVTPDAPCLYVPERITFITSHELQILEESVPPEAG
jgi:hypothetical protein